MPRHRRQSHKRSHRSKKNILNKTLNRSVSLVKTTSKKYIPKVKHGLENVGSKVVKTGEKSVPFFQSLTRKLFGALSMKKSTRRRKH
jgi:hypothetical protein